MSDWDRLDDSGRVKRKNKNQIQKQNKTKIKSKYKIKINKKANFKTGIGQHLRRRRGESGKI